MLPFDAIETGKGATFKAYRWELNLSDAKNFLREFQEGEFSGGPHGQGGVFVTDSQETWKVGNKVLLEMRVSVKNPFKIPDKEFLEQYHDPDLRRLRNEGYDAVVSTPRFFTERQALLLYPEQQISRPDIKRSYAKPRRAEYLRIGNFIYRIAYDPKKDNYYSFNEGSPLPIAEVLRRWAKDHNKPRAWDAIRVDYPLNEVWKYREYTWTREKARQSLEEWDELKASMKKGWDPDNPLILIFGRNGIAKVGEGNHRLAIARELGMSTVPVRFGSFSQEVELTEIEEAPPPKPKPTHKPKPQPKRTPEEEAEVQERVDEIWELLNL
jgi:hypothetical protein